jgi:hypothetical protein
MNNRYLELQKQASIEQYDTNTGTYKYILNPQKFAELLITECLLELEPNLYESDIEYRVDQAFYKRCERIIKQHFGLNNE